MRWWLITLISVVASGCQSDPTFDPFAPYGNRVIPPPPTGSIGQANGYYQPLPATAPPPLPTTSGATSFNTLQPTPGMVLPPQGNWESSSGSGFSQAPGYGPALAATSPNPWDASGNFDPWNGSGAQLPPSTVYIPNSAVAPAQQLAVAPAQYAQPYPDPSYTPMAIRPAAVRPSTGGEIYIPQTPGWDTGQPSQPYYYGYDPMTAAQAGWQPRR